MLNTRKHQYLRQFAFWSVCAKKYFLNINKINTLQKQKKLIFSVFLIWWSYCYTINSIRQWEGAYCNTQATDNAPKIIIFKGLYFMYDMADGTIFNLYFRTKYK